MNLSKGKIALYGGLSGRKQRQKTGLFTAEGAKCVADTLRFFDVEAIAATPEWLSEHKGETDGLPLYEADERELKQISQLQTVPEVIAVYKMPELGKPDMDLVHNSLTLALDGVQDPGNLGTILRTASWFGVQQVVLGTGCVDPFNPKTVQSSMGAIGMIRISQGNLVELLDANPEIPVYGTLLEGKDIYETELRTPAIVVMGNEGNGLSEEIRKRVSSPLLIPSFASGSHAESLNVAAATAVTLSEFRRRIEK